MSRVHSEQNRYKRKHEFTFTFSSSYLSRNSPPLLFYIDCWIAFETGVSRLWESQLEIANDDAVSYRRLLNSSINKLSRSFIFVLVRGSIISGTSYHTGEIFLHSFAVSRIPTLLVSYFSIGTYHYASYSSVHWVPYLSTETLEICTKYTLNHNG